METVVSEWKAWNFTRKEERFGSVLVMARSWIEAVEVGQRYIYEFDMDTDVQEDDAKELDQSSCEKYCPLERPYTPTDFPSEWKKLTVKEIFKEIGKLKMVPGTDEYQEHWEPLGQQRMFERSDD